MELKLKKMKQILIALDNNGGAKKVAETGYELAKALGAHTILLHVTSHATYYSSPNYSPILGFDSFSTLDMVQTNTVPEFKRKAEDYLDRMKWTLGDATIQTIIKEGDFAENISQTAKEMDADIIVMGTHNRKGLDKILLGSLAENVLHHTLIPLFIIPLKAAEKNTDGFNQND